MLKFFLPKLGWEMGLNHHFKMQNIREKCTVEQLSTVAKQLTSTNYVLGGLFISLYFMIVCTLTTENLAEWILS